MKGTLRWVATALPFLLLPSAPAWGQGTDRLHLSSAGTATWDVTIVRHRGYPAVSAEALAVAGWEVARIGDRYGAALPGGRRMELHPGAPYLRLDSVWIQLVSAPYELGDTLFVPLQLLTDLLPDRLPALYASSGSLELLVRPDSLWRAGGIQVGADPGDRAVPMAAPVDPRDDGVRVVIIDPGHGGVDPGTLGWDGRTREKDVALAVGLALARALEGEPGLEVHLTRDSDVLIPLWQRGEIATRLKGDRYGIFVSIHANAVPIRDVRGVETYYLDLARTEHEARVAALENSAADFERERPSRVGEGELGAIISELLNDDFQHWSSELADSVQAEITEVHPGPNRGVKQAPLAVLTNAMMPSVLVELGFLSNPDEERLLGDPEFHAEVAERMARAVKEFFQRYPPGNGSSRGER